MPKAPVEIGETYDVEATRLNDDGDGVASVQGFTVFVRGLLTGETANITISDVDKRFARGTINGEPTRSASHREVPLCSVFGDCGGCQLQHLSYAEQLRHKQAMVAQTLARSAGLPDVPVLPTLGMEHPWRYRNQVQVPLYYDSTRQKLVQGFFSHGSHRIVETDVCHLSSTEMEQTVRSVVQELEDVLGPKSSAVHHVIVRQSYSNHQQMVILCVRNRDVVNNEVLRRLQTIPLIATIAVTVQSRPHGPVWGNEVKVLWGEPTLTERIGHLEFLISPRSFFQVNTSQAAKLYETAVEYADVASTDTVVDAYCGTGTMTLLFAQHAKQVLGIEVVSEAIADAKRNAKHNHLDNAEFVVGEVEQILPRRIASGERFDIAVLDPPRKGCHPDVLAALGKAAPKRIVYVSCNHVTFARDVKVLHTLGYQLLKVQPVDMFPQTSHVECCSLLVRKG